jgi:hypothetical protein
MLNDFLHFWSQEASTFPSTFRPAHPKGPPPNYPTIHPPTQSLCTVVTLSHSKEVRKKKQKPEEEGGGGVRLRAFSRNAENDFLETENQPPNQNLR